MKKYYARRIKMEVKIGFGKDCPTNLLNMRRMEVKTFINVEEGKADVSGDEEWIQRQVESGKAILFPVFEELYPYSEALTEFIDKYELDIPDYITIKKFLIEKGWMQLFYEFQGQELEKKFRKWCRRNSITFVD